MFIKGSDNNLIYLCMHVQMRFVNEIGLHVIHIREIIMII